MPILIGGVGASHPLEEDPAPKTRSHPPAARDPDLIRPRLHLLGLFGAVLASAWFLASPTRAAVPLDPELARLPVELRIIQAPVFEQPLGLVGEKLPPRHESEDLWRAIDVLREHGIGLGFEALELFLEEYPESAWAPALRSRLALRYRELGRHTLALGHWEAAWTATANTSDPTGRDIADFTLAHWTGLLAALGRVEPLAEILGQTADRLLDAGPLLERFLSVQQAFEAMVMDPGHANACGVRALEKVARELGVDRASLAELAAVSAPLDGFSLADLATLAKRVGLSLSAVHRPAEAQYLVVPSVIHWRLDHFGALLAVSDGYGFVDDPLFGHPRWVPLEVLEAEASGYFLVPTAATPAGWWRLSASEAAAVRGRSAMMVPSHFDDDGDEDCPKTENPDLAEPDENAPINAHDPNNQIECEECPPGDASDGEDCEETDLDCGDCDGKGLAVWRVSEPNLNLWILDTPVYYTTSFGRRIPFTLAYRSRNQRPLDGSWGLGPRWETSRLSYVRIDSGSPGQAEMYAAQGGRRIYNPDGATRHQRSNTRMETVAGGYQVRHRTGARNRYTYAQTFYSGTTRYYQTQQIDRRGRITYLNHLTQGNLVLLGSVQDPDGNFTYFDYSEFYPERLTQVRAPYGLTAEFFYNANGQLWKIEDAQQPVSQFTYDSQGRIDALITPYGTTTFAWSPDVAPGTGNIVNRALIVTEPGGRKHLYAYRNNSAKLSNASGAPDLLPSSYGPAEVPNTPANDTLNNSGLHS